LPRPAVVAPPAPPSDITPEAMALAEDVIGAIAPTATESSHHALLLRVGRLLDRLSSPEACAAELRARRALWILVPDAECVFLGACCRGRDRRVAGGVRWRLPTAGG
jgi:hypothetical protein